jgi:hypothetical protein
VHTLHAHTLPYTHLRQAAAAGSAQIDAGTRRPGGPASTSGSSRRSRCRCRAACPPSAGRATGLIFLRHGGGVHQGGLRNLLLQDILTTVSQQPAVMTCGADACTQDRKVCVACSQGRPDDQGCRHQACSCCAAAGRLMPQQQPGNGGPGTGWRGSQLSGAQEGAAKAGSRCGLRCLFTSTTCGRRPLPPPLLT